MNENTIIRAYLLTQANITDLVSNRIYASRLVEGATLPAISFFCRGGPGGNPYVEPDTNGSFQFDCWSESPLEARDIYIELRDALQGITNTIVTVDGHNYIIQGAQLEVPGIDEVDVDIPEYFKTRAFFRIQVRLTDTTITFIPVRWGDVMWG